jgi:hypothetical protein
MGHLQRGILISGVSRFVVRLINFLLSSRFIPKYY